MVASAAKIRGQRWVEKLQIPSSKFQRTSKSQTPNTKLQTPKKSQVPSSKPRPALRTWNLELGASLVFGAWILVFRFRDFFGACCLEVGACASLHCCWLARLLVTPGMESPKSGKPDIHSEKFLRSLMRKQLRLSVTCAATFLVALLGLPLLNYFFPDLMATRVFGFTLTWFLLGVLFFPLVWLISWFFIRRSIALEAAEVEEAEAGEQAGK